MSSKKRSWISDWIYKRSLAYPYAVIVVALMTFLLFLVRERLNISTVALLFLLPVLLSTTLWGLGPGILSGILTFLSYNFFFIAPYYTLLVHESQEIIALVIFFVIAILINQLVGREKKSLEAALAREHESTSLYEFSVGLAGLNDLKEIASVIAQKTLETFQAEAVNIRVEKIYAEDSFSAVAGNTAAADQAQPVAETLLETARGVLGEIRLWRGHAPLSWAELRLLRTFAAQGALALERSALAHSETRAKVLEESDRLKSALLHSVSHELRTPLVTIKAATTSLLSHQVKWDSEARQELLTAVDEEADLLNHLVSNLLNMSRIESGAMKPNRQWNFLPEIVDVVIGRMHRTLGNTPLRVEIPDELPLVPVDYMQMEQVFTNLISNSFKYAPAGSEIRIRAKAIHPDNLLVQVTNQGPPVEAEHLERIFDKFYRVTYADKVSGTGLGLSICKGIIEAHGGRIWAENLPEGFTFHFTLPLTWDGMQPPLVKSEGE
ncbi:MAG: DUF4118 domain-containing protein [Chloroflexota bacterium]|nr:MAG: DUF4118 domain-containing protein [Chloroflexota bacterium]